MLLSRSVLILICSVTAFGLTLLSQPIAVRFPIAPLNYWFTGLASLAVPLSTLVLAKSMRPGSDRFLLVGLALFLAVPLVPYGLLAISEGSRMTNGTDPSFRLVSELSHPPGTYRLYQTDCGATCAYGLELRREFSVLGVVRVVAPVWQANNEEPASLRLSADGAVQVVRGEYVLHQFHQ